MALEAVKPRFAAQGYDAMLTVERLEGTVGVIFVIVRFRPNRRVELSDNIKISGDPSHAPSTTEVHTV